MNNIRNIFSYLVGGFIFVVSSIQITINTFSNQLSVQDALSKDGLLMLVGIFLIINNLIFKPDEPNDERAKDIRMKSGYYSYLLTLAIIFIFFLLANYNVLSFSFAMLLSLLIAILTLPICLITFNKKM